MKMRMKACSSTSHLLIFVSIAIFVFPFLFSNVKAEGEAVHFHDKHEQREVVHILNDTGFASLAMHFMSSNLLVGRKGPLTLFAPTEEAFHNSSSSHFSPKRLSHHVVKGLFTYADLQKMPHGAKLHTISHNHALLVTTNGNERNHSSTHWSVYVNGVLVSHPDIFNDGLLVVHGVNSFLDSSHSPSAAHSSPSSSTTTKMHNKESSICDESHSPPAPLVAPFMLMDAALNLRDRGYSILALALRIKSPELLRLHTLTIFTLNDDSIFLPGQGGQDFVNNVRYHVIPNKRLSFSDLQALPVGTRLDSLKEGQSLVVTGSHPFAVNDVGVKNSDVFSNRWMVVHQITQPLIRSHYTEFEVAM